MYAMGKQKKGWNEMDKVIGFIICIVAGLIVGKILSKLL